jgi:hypothetical protein
MVVAPTFAATEVSVLDEHGVLVTTLSAPSTEDDDFYLMFQHKEPYTAQDTKLGMNKPYVEYCGQGCSWYGEMDAVELFTDRLLVRMSKVAAEHMQNGGLLEVSFSCGVSEFSQLRDALRRTFNGQSYFIDRV